MKISNISPWGKNNKITIPERFSLAIKWLKVNTINDTGVAVSSANLVPYPEVTGYLIPTLLQWGEHELAHRYGQWLISIQCPDGSWTEPGGNWSYTFDTGQVLKGLVTLADSDPGYNEAVLKGCEWMCSQIQKNGRITTPDKGSWQLPGGRIIPEAIHLYAIEPLRRVGRKLGVSDYEQAVDRSLDFYLNDLEGLTRFNTLSHFHAYILEALLDLEHRDIAATAMKELVRWQRNDGTIPGYQGTKWVCSTGLLQYAVILYRLGDLQRADAAFLRACKLQNPSGGFYGSYGSGANYFPKEEISWAVKYFLDALRWKIVSGFDAELDNFPEKIDRGDGRCSLLYDVVKSVEPKQVLEVGCGKGRFLNHLASDFPSATFTGLDLSEKMLSYLHHSVTPLRGSLLDIPCPDGSYEFVYCIEALEHAVNISGAIREICRVVAPGGVLVIIDKNRERQGRLRISEWEQWFDLPQITNLLSEQGFSVEERSNITYDSSNGSDELFIGWIAVRRNG
ncbi:MAG: methyltransferase domain-containing protein [Sedimentisphaerales bacterium]|nr:methyltransferase domain-containing protein [Sedimentisphaerales bacterium]